MAQYIIDISEPGFDDFTEDQTRDFIAKTVVPQMVEVMTLCRQIARPEVLPRGGEFGCSASTAGGGSISCGGSIRW